MDGSRTRNLYRYCCPVQWSFLEIRTQKVKRDPIAKTPLSICLSQGCILCTVNRDVKYIISENFNNLPL